MTGVGEGGYVGAEAPTPKADGTSNVPYEGGEERALSSGFGAEDAMEAGEKAPTCSVRSRRIIRDAQSANDGRRNSEMFPATVPLLKSSHDPSAPRLALTKRAREKVSRSARDDSEAQDWPGLKPGPTVGGRHSEERRESRLVAMGGAEDVSAKRVRKAAPLRHKFSLEVSSSKVTPRESDGYVGPKGPTPKAAEQAG
jgi:hypothetical protein